MDTLSEKELQAYPILSFLHEGHYRESTYSGLQTVVQARFSRVHRLLHLLSCTGKVAYLMGFVYFCFGTIYLIFLGDNTCFGGILPRNVSFLMYGPCGGMLLSLLAFAGGEYCKSRFASLQETWLWFSHAHYNYKAGYSSEKPVIKVPKEHDDRLSWALLNIPIYLMLCVFIPVSVFAQYKASKLKPPPVRYLPVTSTPILKPSFNTYLTLYLPSLKIRQSVWDDCTSSTTEEWQERLQAKSPRLKKKDRNTRRKMFSELRGHLLISRDGYVRDFWLTHRFLNLQRKANDSKILMNPPQILQLPEKQAQRLSLRTCMNVSSQELSGIKRVQKTSESVRCVTLTRLSTCLTPHIKKYSRFSSRKQGRWVSFPLSIGLRKTYLLSHNEKKK